MFLMSEDTSLQRFPSLMCTCCVLVCFAINNGNVYKSALIGPSRTFLILIKLYNLNETEDLHNKGVFIRNYLVLRSELFFVVKI